ncbi:MAG: 3-oxoacyl-ACP reductase FabG [Clostridia bacterium]|nr:3-oxoacyl-ACP reductase FabG [Clostridia bacterium]
MNVLITGGSRGIGAACVRAFVQRGDRVAFFYRQNHAAAEALASETDTLAICADVSDPEVVCRSVEEALSALGSIDVLVSNAGISQIKLLGDVSDEDWRSMIDTNLSGAFYVTRAVTKNMVANHRGSIVFIGSMWGKTGASCEAHYSASKAGLRGLTMALAKELGPSNITVNCIEPGVIDTEMNAELDGDTRRALCDATPLCRIGRAEEVASAVCFLASDTASFITGQILGVDGGFAV